MGKRDVNADYGNQGWQVLVWISSNLMLIVIYLLAIFDDTLHGLDKWDKVPKVSPELCSIGNLEEVKRFRLLWQATPARTIKPNYSVIRQKRPTRYHPECFLS